ncbi:ferritin family protein [Fibrobacterota bacterium]
MSSTDFGEIIDFAIEEEVKAYTLYEETAGKTDDNSLKSLLTDMADMERGHEARLKAFKKGKIESIGSVQVEDLKIGDYLVDVEINENSSVQDILLFAIKAEMKAHELYTQLERLYAEPEERALFQKLANEELQHKNDLEKVYDDYVYKEN